MKRLVRVSALFTVLLLAGSTTASADDNKPIRVSQGDPFASCTGVGANGGGRSYSSAEVEPWIAVNPKNTSNVIGAWQQDRWSDGGAKGQVAGWSFDGGRTWGRTPQPFTLCAQPYYRSQVLQYERTSDPWISVGPDGTVYSVSLPFDGDFIRGGLGTAVSKDGGRTWIQQQDIDPLVARADTFNPADDKQSVTADPQKSGVAYVVWDQLRDIFPPCPPPPAHSAVRRAHPAGHKAMRSAAPKTSAEPCPNGVFTGPTMFSSTRNGGKTWSKPRVIVPTGVNEQTIGNVIVADPQGEALYDFFNFIDGDGRSNIEMVFSNDGGAHWSAPQYVQRLFTTAEKRQAGCGCGVVYPGDETQPLRTGDVIPEAAIDPNTGQLYVIWQDGRPNGFQNDMLLASTSTAGGLTGTWSTPKLVNPPNDKAAFTASIAVNGSGRVGVAYYDFTPPLTSPDILLTDAWFTQTDGPGLNFGARTLIGGPFNMEAAPVARGFFTGDYLGLAAQVANRHGDRKQNSSGDSEDRFVALFVMTNCTDNSCKAQFSYDGTPVGPDSTDVVSAVPSASDGNFGP
jgi:hypothetical protein